jgi:hypothetical protein
MKRRAALRVAVIATCVFGSVHPMFATAQEGSSAMAQTADCGKNALERSRCMIEAILADLSTTYTQVGGGGISDIRMTATDTYAVSMPQEERVDIITYELALKDDGTVAITGRTEESKTRGE